MIWTFSHADSNLHMWYQKVAHEIMLTLHLHMWIQLFHRFSEAISLFFSTNKWECENLFICDWLFFTCGSEFKHVGFAFASRRPINKIMCEDRLSHYWRTPTSSLELNNWKLWYSHLKPPSTVSCSGNHSRSTLKVQLKYNFEVLVRCISIFSYFILPLHYISEGNPILQLICYFNCRFWS